ncbi:MAG: hypothetical protein CMP47_02885 [Rickettsiales bacterium]|nr:hypothetical protein [Rickettsiales bacterium]
MGYIKKSELISEYKSNHGDVRNIEARVFLSSLNLIMEGFKAHTTECFDIFLSHSYQDARAIVGLKDKLQKVGFTVYVDWIEDQHLDRGKVTEKTAAVLRERMKSSKALIYATSQSAAGSVWMPWELGYMDSCTGLVAVAPILEDDESFDGREYLGLYPYLDLTNDSFFIQKSHTQWVTLTDWLRGMKIK